MVPGLVGWVGTLFCIRSKTLATMLCNLTIILILHHNLTMASNKMLTCDEEKEEKEHVLRKLGQAGVRSKVAQICICIRLRACDLEF